MKTKFTLILFLIALAGMQKAPAQCPSSLTLSVTSVTHATCPDAGSVTLGGTGIGYAGVVYSIVAGPSHNGMQQNSNVFNSLSAGTYTFKAACGGQVAQVNAVVNNLYTAINPNFSVSVSGTCTNYTSGGTITVGAVSGGKAPVTYSFIQNDFANYDDALSVYSPSNTFTTAVWGTYQVRVKDACGVFLTKTIRIEPEQEPAIFGGGNVYFDNVACDSARLSFWINNDQWEGMSLTDYSKLRFRIFEKGTGCTAGALIKSFELSGNNQSFIIPRRDVFVEITTACGEVRTNCYDYPDDDHAVTHWMPVIKGCGTAGNPYTLTIKHLYNEYSNPPFTIDLYNNSTNAFIRTGSYSSNWACATYTNLPIDQYRVVLTDACGKKDTAIIIPESGSPGIAPVDGGTDVNPDCSFSNGKTSVKLKLTGFIANLDISTLTISSGPDNIGQSSTISGDGRFNFTNLTPGAVYGFTLDVNCSIVNLSFTVPTDEWRAVYFELTTSATQQCGGSGTISANVDFRNWGNYITQLWKNGVLLESSNNDTYNNVAPGLYEVRAIARQDWCDGPKSYTISDTVRIYPDGTPPQLLRQFAFVCGTGTTGSATIEVAGFGPFKYEIKRMNPSPESDYTLIAANAPGHYTFSNLQAYATYNLLITDNCGKSTVSQITVGEIGEFSFENFYQPCVGSAYAITAPDIAGAAYHWTKQGSPLVLSTTRSIYFPVYSKTYDGEYTCTISLNGSCLTRTITANLNGAAFCYVLPVKLSSWTVTPEECGAKLKWETAANEEGNYIIEQSTDNIHFNAVKEISATAKDGTAIFEYVYNELESGNNYFRLKFVTAAGKTEYSSTLITKKKCDTHTAAIKVMPNPVVNADIQSRQPRRERSERSKPSLRSPSLGKCRHDCCSRTSPAASIQFTFRGDRPPPVQSRPARRAIIGS